MTDDLDTFRAETRAWLEANCPAEMREPVRSDADVVWGGRDQSKSRCVRGRRRSLKRLWQAGQLSVAR